LSELKRTATLAPRSEALGSGRCRSKLLSS